MLRAVPPITLVPMALLAFGFSVRTELTLVVYASAWPVLVNTLEGVRSVRPELQDVARTLRLSRTAAPRKVVVPAAAPSVFVGLQLALSLALVLAVVAELVGNPAGIGNGLVLAQLALRPEEMFVYFFTIGLLGIGLNAGLRLLAARVPATTRTGGGGRDGRGAGRRRPRRSCFDRSSCRCCCPSSSWVCALRRRWRW